MIKNVYIKGRQEIADEYNVLCKTYKGNDKSLKTYDYKKACKKFEIGMDKIEDNASILDIGCGTGNLIKYLKETIQFNEKNYTGIDFSQEMVNYCKIKYPQSSFLKGDLLESDRKSEYYLELYDKYDYVVCLSAFQQKPKYIDQQIYIYENIKLFFSLLKKGGRVVFDIFSDKFVDYIDDNLIYLNPEQVLSFCFKLSYSIKLDSSISPYEVVFSVNNVE